MWAPGLRTCSTGSHWWHWPASTHKLLDVMCDRHRYSITLSSHVMAAILSSAETEKKRQCCWCTSGKFQPFCTFCWWCVRLNFFIKHVSEGSAIQWNKPSWEIAGWLRTRIAFAVIGVTNLCLRGSTGGIKWRHYIRMVQLIN